MSVKEKITQFLESKTPEEIETMKVKTVRKGVAEMFGIQVDDLDKTVVQQHILEYFKKQAEQDVEAEASAEDDDSAAPATKSRKKKASDTAGGAAKKARADGEKSAPTCWVRTPKGVEPPKYLKKLQSKSMKTKTFLAKAGCVAPPVLCVLAVRVLM